MSVRTMGVEEELLLVDPTTGLLRHESQAAMRAYRRESARNPRREPKVDDDSSVGQDVDNDAIEQELFLAMLETNTAPLQSLTDLRKDVRRCRRAAAEAASAVGVSVAAVAAPVLGDVQSPATPKDRYQRIVHDFGATGRNAIVCGMHVHVEIGSDEEAVGVLDRLRPWLPVIRALSVNSPFTEGFDSGYASWRTQIWNRWPTAGPSDLFGDHDGYLAATQALSSTGAAFDRGMLYLDARLAEAYPTVEVRVADVCTELDDVMLIAALVRGLVTTTSAEWAAGEPAPAWRVDFVRASHWLASKAGMSARLVHPQTGELARARDVMESVISYVQPALEETGDLEEVRSAFESLMARGTGATRQRSVAEANGGDLVAVVADLRARTEASCAD